MKEKFISVEKLEKYFKIGKIKVDVLKGATFSVDKGEMLGIMGFSGAGKSTLLHILGTLDRPTGGKVFYEGSDIYSFNNREIAEFRNLKVGFVFQFNQLLPEFTALENTMMPAWINRLEKIESLERATWLLEIVGLKERINHKPGELSGGEQQRVAIARSLMNNPSVVLADEPTGNLDRNTGQSISKILRRLNEEMNQTFIIVTHNDALAAQMDRVIEIEEGQARVKV